MRTPLRVAATAATYLLALVVVTLMAGITVLFVAGPHAGLLPEPLEVAVQVLGWLTVLLLPAGIAWKAWWRFGAPIPANTPPPPPSAP